MLHFRRCRYGLPVFLLVVDVQVTAGDQTTRAGLVAYNRPVVYSVSPGRLDALDTEATRPAVYISGVDFGLPFVNSMTVSPRHMIRLGNATCGSVVWVSDSVVSCRLDGVYPVSGCGDSCLHQ